MPRTGRSRPRGLSASQSSQRSAGLASANSVAAAARVVRALAARRVEVLLGHRRVGLPPPRVASAKCCAWHAPRRAACGACLHHYQRAPSCVGCAHTPNHLAPLQPYAGRWRCGCPRCCRRACRARCRTCRSSNCSSRGASARTHAFCAMCSTAAPNHHRSQPLSQRLRLSSLPSSARVAPCATGHYHCRCQCTACCCRSCHRLWQRRFHVASRARRRQTSSQGLRRQAVLHAQALARRNRRRWRCRQWQRRRHAAG